MDIQERRIRLDSDWYFVKAIRSTDSADRPWLVFLHDALGSVRQWKQFPESLARQTTLNALVFDRKGHGQSGPLPPRAKDYMHVEAYQVLPQLLTQLHIDNPILIGHSDGGTIALLYAARYSVRAVISMAAHVFVEKITLESIQNVDQDRALLIQKLEKYHGLKARPLYFAWRDTWLSKAFRDFNIEEEIGGVSAPLFVIQAKDDAFGSDRQVTSILQNVSSETKKTYTPSSGGHQLYLSDMEGLVDLIAQFLQK
jgi:pimeloyl-ACP methyl ester carboxylesterase